MDAFDSAFGAMTLFVVVILSVAVLMLLFVYVPVRLYTDAECLRMGYPKSAVTVGLERYCMNLDGTVSVRVERVSKAQ